MSKLVISASERSHDLELAQKIAAEMGAQAAPARSAEEVEMLLKKFPEAFVLWDVDHKEALSTGSGLAFQRVGQVLLKKAKRSRVVALTDGALNEVTHLLNIQGFGHHITRQKSDSIFHPIAKVFTVMDQSESFSVTSYLPEGTQLQRIILKRSGDRKAATEAINNVLGRMGVPPRLASVVAQASDELMMNAIFDAPVENGESYRQAESRTAQFDLTGKEKVSMHLGSCENYILLSVSDQFGSLAWGTVMSAGRKDYAKRKYSGGSQGGVGAGLGIYGMLQAGMSLVYVVEPGVRTQAMLFVPMIRQFKQFRDSFRLLSFIEIN